MLVKISNFEYNAIVGKEFAFILCCLQEITVPYLNNKDKENILLTIPIVKNE